MTSERSITKAIVAYLRSEGCVFGEQGCPEDALRVCGACRKRGI